MNVVFFYFVTNVAVIAGTLAVQSTGVSKLIFFVTFFLLFLYFYHFRIQKLVLPHLPLNLP